MLILSLTAAGASFLYFRGQNFDPSPWHRVVVVLLIGAGLLLMEGPLRWLWRILGGLYRNSTRGTQRRQPGARAGMDGDDAGAIATEQFTALKSALREAHGWRWRTARRWLLVSGDASAVESAIPGLSFSHWQLTEQAVLLYGGPSDQIDRSWIKVIRRSRFRRPIDAFVAILKPGASQASFDSDALARGLFQQSRALRWAAPAYLVSAVPVDSEQPDSVEAVAGTWTGNNLDSQHMRHILSDLSLSLADGGVECLAAHRGDRYLAQLSRDVAGCASGLSAIVARINGATSWRTAVQGIFFEPIFHAVSKEGGEEDVAGASQTWDTIALHSTKFSGGSAGLSPANIAAWGLGGLAGLWIFGLIISGIANQRMISSADATINELRAAPTPTREAVALDALQKQIDTLEYRDEHGTPWHAGFGLNHDSDLLAGLWQSYDVSAKRVVVTPVRLRLENELRQLGALTDQTIANSGEGQVTAAYTLLKTYLMMAKPQHTDAVFLSARLVALEEPARPRSSSLTQGEWRDLSGRLVKFYAEHLGVPHAGVGVSPALTPDLLLVASARQTLIGIIGLRNSVDLVYEQIINENEKKYPPTTLQALLGDSGAQGLFSTNQALPGVFTRAAWDERIGKAIDDADEQRTAAGDWVLTDTKMNSALAGSLRATLRERYFSDFARAWQLMLNGVHWQRSSFMSGAVDQLILLADPQRSPLQALMKVVTYEAKTGTIEQSLSDTLLNKAGKLVESKEAEPTKAAAQATKDDLPLADAFGPLLRLNGVDLSTANGSNAPQAMITSQISDISLARYLVAVTVVRLKLQQIMNSSDPGVTSRIAAQSILQGKASEIGESRDYANRVVASLGQQWAGLADALFQKPLDQTWGMVLQPAAANLNTTWQSAIVTDWNNAFGGRYPFADTSNDISLPELGRFIRTDNGVIAQFVTTQLAGVIERQGDHWVAVDGGATQGSLTVDPAFLNALNRLTHVANVVFPSGDAQVRYELRPVPTVGVSEMTLKLSGRELDYVNWREEWMPFVWPGDGLENDSHLEWQTSEGGLRTDMDYAGRFGLIRMLEKAGLNQLDSARYLLKWQPDQSKGVALQVQLRSEAGAGPLDVLLLRHFTLPSRIFLGAGDTAAPSPRSNIPGRKAK